jgi:hypothetical protein
MLEDIGRALVAEIPLTELRETATAFGQILQPKEARRSP